MTREQLFVYTIKDLEKKLAATDQYEILMIAGLLRKLLLDGTPLMDQINTGHLRVKFIINSRPIPEDKYLSIWSIEDGLDPATAVPHLCKPIEVDRGQLLSTKILKVGGKVFSVKDVILHLAHVEGAVHAGSTKDEKDLILNRFIQEWQIGGVAATFRLLKAIARVTVKGLQVLESSLTSKV